MAKDGKLYLSKVGDIKIKLHRPIKGQIKTLTITKEADGWYACFSVEVTVRKTAPKLVRSAVGVDVGLESFATLSDGTQIENPRWFRKAEKKLALHQRNLSRKQLKSLNRDKQRDKVAKLHKKTANQRKDFQHKVSRQLVEGNDLIAYEDLNVRGMVKNRHLAKSISDAGWRQFIAFVCYKAEEAGSMAVAVNPFSTSIDCSGCGFPVEKTLAQRIHKCPNCGLEIPRDWNAALNIRKLGLLSLPQELRDVKPVETGTSAPCSKLWSGKQEATDFNRW